MKRMFATGGGLAFAFALGSAVLAQTAGQTPPQPQAPAMAQSEQQVTIVGCVQREADYRRAHNLGRGGAVGTGVGVDNEFVLVNASAAPGASASDTAGTSGASSIASEQAFELSGQSEGEVGKYVGKRVEIIGKLKPAAVGTTGPTGGATAGTPPAGVDVTSPDLKLREIEVISVKESTGTCPEIK